MTCRLAVLFLACNLLSGTGHTFIDPTRTATYQQRVFDARLAWIHLSHILSIGPRPAGSLGSTQTRLYIKNELSKLGLVLQEQAFTVDTPQGPVSMANLSLRFPGARSERILITGHYDTKYIPNFRFLGANDGGSSTAFLLELARVLTNRAHQFTWEIVWFDGEEAFCQNWTDCRTPTGAPDNTYGSRHYIDRQRSSGQLQSIRAMLLVDMIAERDARFRRETRSSAWLKDIIWSTAADIGYAHMFLSSEVSIEDDHWPFLDVGIPAVDIIDLEYGGPSMPWWHSPHDTVDKLSPATLQAVGDVLVASLPKIDRAILPR